MAEVAAPGIADAVIDLTQERIDTYNAFYRSDQADVYDGRYSGLMNAYKVAVGLQGDAAVTEGRTLLGNILQTKELPQAVLMLLPSDKKLLLVHRLYYFPKPLGNVEATDWEDKVLGFVSDVMGTQLPQSVIMEDAVLTPLSNKVKVLKTVALRVALEGNATLNSFPPVSELVEPANYDEVYSRTAMCVPPKYINVFLGKRLTPREGFLALEREVRENDDEIPMQPLIDWLRVALTRENVEPTSLSSIVLPQAPGVPMVTPELAIKLQWLVKSDLTEWQQEPTRAPTALPINSGAQQTQLEQLLLAQLLRQQGAGVNGKEEKPPSSLFKGTISLLLRLTNKVEESEPPQMS